MSELSGNVLGMYQPASRFPKRKLIHIGGLSTGNPVGRVKSAL